MLPFNDLIFPTCEIFISKYNFSEAFKAPSGFHGKQFFVSPFLLRITFINCFVHLKMVSV